MATKIIYFAKNTVYQNSNPTFRAKMKHNLNPVMNAQLDRNRRFKGHRRNLSDPRFSTSLTDAYGEDEVSL